MGKKTTFNITPPRRKIVLAMLEKQHTIGTLATSFDVTEKTMSKALTKAGIVPAKFRQTGIANLRSRMFDRLELIVKDKDYVDLAFKIVDKYETPVDDGADDDTTGSKVDDVLARIKLEIM